MARRGYLAERQYQQRLAEQQAEQRQRAALREYNTAVRAYEQARKADERATAAAARASEAESKHLEREAAEAHSAAMQAEVTRRNTDLAAVYDQVDNLLAATLEHDDYVDLESLRVTVEHPPFDRLDLTQPVPPPAPVLDPTPPQRRAIEQPSGLLGRKKKLADATAAAEAEYATVYEQWRKYVAALPAHRKALADHHAGQEAERQRQLAIEQQRYAEQCHQREADAELQNAQLDALIANLGYGTVDAVQEYVSIVLANSVYPERFQVEHDASFDPSTAELQLHVVVPGPDTVPATKAYKYVKAKDEISATALSQKACKDRYAAAVQQVALRSLHEIFEADRRGLIRAISLEVGTTATHPATGTPSYIPFVAVAVGRDAFLEFDLAGVVPAATLEHLGGAVSKNPFQLVAIDASGIRKA